MRQHNADRCDLTWAAIDLKEGIPKGAFLTPTRVGPTWTQMETGTGKVVRSFQPGTSGTLIVPVIQQSVTQKKLYDIAKLDVLTRIQVYPLILTDNTSKKIITYTNAYLQTIPDEPYAFEPGVFNWVWGYEEVSTEYPDPNQNVVGS